jgi:spore germination cell wall hydrolase CwlJ-like protein
MEKGFHAGITASLVILGTAFAPSRGEAYTPDPWERQVVASCLVLEASSEGPIGLMAVANVIANRADGNARRYYKVVRKPYAFSSMNPATEGKTQGQGFAPLVRRASRDPNWGLSLRIVDKLYAGQLQDLTGGATHFALKAKRSSWMSGMKVTAVIGNHKFMRQP